MKRIKYILIFAIVATLNWSCNEGIDPITPVDQGAELTAPTATVIAPSEGALLKIPEGKGLPINIEVVDDIDLKSVSILFDGVEITKITDFKDYRRYSPVDGFVIQNFANGGHTVQVIATDLSGKTTSSKVVNFSAITITKFVPKYGEVFYMSFDNQYFEFASLTDAKEIKSPGFGEGKIGGAYAGATDAYLTFPTKDILGTEFSATFWYNINAIPARSGILVIGPKDEAAPKAMNNRLNGFRLFREGGATNQVIKLNVGNGLADGWFDGGAAATLNPTTVEWVHIAFTISTSHVALYINGDIVSEGDYGPVDWTGCDILSIASGAPRFTGWDHLSDLSLYDELRIYKKALTQDEIRTIINAEK